MTRIEAHAKYDQAIHWGARNKCRQKVVQYLGRTDLFYLLVFILHRIDCDNDWVFARCRQVQADPNGYVDLWAREHYKSSLIAFGLIIQDLANDPEKTFGIFSYSRPAAKKAMRVIKVELETNRTLQELFPDVFWRNPQNEAPKWSEDDGLVVKRKGNPKESSIEAWGLVDGQPVGPHFSDLLYEDIVNKDMVRTPEAIKKLNEGVLESLNLGQTGGRRRADGTRWHYADSWGMLIERGVFKERRWTATKDNTFTGEPWLFTREELAQKIKDYGPYIASCQLFMNPTQDSLQVMKKGWLRYWKADRYRGLNLYLLCDPASAKKKDSDYTVFIVIGMGSDRNYYVINWIRDRLSLTERANILFKWHQTYKPVNVGYEKYGMQSDIEHFRDRMERDNYRFGVQELGGPLSKVSRIDRLIPIFSQHRLYIPDTTPYTQYDGETIDLTRAFVNDEYLVHPFEVHDDMEDCLARILDDDLGAMFPQGEEIDPLKIGQSAKQKEYDPLRY